MIQNDTPALSLSSASQFMKSMICFYYLYVEPMPKIWLDHNVLPWSESNQSQMLQPLHLPPLILSWSQSDVFNMQGVAFCTFYSFCLCYSHYE